MYDFRPVRVEGQDLHAVAGVVRDVTLERRLVQDLSESEARLQFALETLAIGAWDVNLATGEVERTGELDRVFGNEEPPEEWVAESTTDYVVEEDQEKVRAAYETAIGNGERLYLKYRIRRVDGEIRQVEVHGRPVRDDAGNVIRYAGTIQDVTDREEAADRQARLQAELTESEDRIRRLFDASPVFIAMTEGPDHVYAYSNPPHDAICGHRPLIGKPMLEALPELEGQGIVERFDEVLRTGETLRVPEFKAVFDRNADGEMETGWFTQTLEPLRDGEGRTVGVATFAYEVTDIVEARERAQASEAQKSLLLNELQHRVKNTMATTLAIVKFSTRGAADAATLKRVLTDRLESIARTHDLLVANDWRGARLEEVFRREVMAYAEEAGERIRFEGDDPLLSAKQVLSLTLAFHELATNAAKHGALSNGAGRVTLSSRLDGEGTLQLSWQEEGGPPLAEEAANPAGFGTILLERIVGPDLEGETEVVRGTGGLRWTIAFPL
jgi:two-component system CheB/CheR fusion protein